MDTYENYAKQVQTAIGFNPNKKALEPKHLRVGIDMGKADMKGLVELLIAKGIFTADEYVEAITNSAAHEAELHRTALAEEMGIDDPNTITLG